jgi:dTDP-4-dehydrorhamnose reductase
MKKTVLIIGISSFVGSNLAQLLKDDYRVIGSYYKTAVTIAGITCVACDVLKKEYVMNLVGLFKPDVTIYAVGLSSLTECQLKPKQADALNSVGAINACVAAERYGSKFILLSSAFVLGGDDLLYREGDMPMPVTAYGSSLSASEFYVQRSCLNYLIFRSSVLYGRSHNALHENWFEILQRNFFQNIPISADDSVKTGFLDIMILGKILIAALEANVSNRLFHISSSDWMTRYEFASLYAKIFKKDANLVQRVNIPFPAEQTHNKKDGHNYSFKLDTSNIAEFLGAKLPSVEESLQITYKRMSST